MLSISLTVHLVLIIPFQSLAVYFAQVKPPMLENVNSLIEHQVVTIAEVLELSVKVLHKSCYYNIIHVFDLIDTR